MQIRGTRPDEFLKVQSLLTQLIPGLHMAGKPCGMR